MAPLLLVGLMIDALGGESRSRRNDEIRMTAEALRDVHGATGTNDDSEGVF